MNSHQPPRFTKRKTIESKGARQDPAERTRSPESVEGPKGELLSLYAIYATRAKNRKVLKTKKDREAAKKLFESNARMLLDRLSPSDLYGLATKQEDDELKSVARRAWEFKAAGTSRQLRLKPLSELEELFASQLDPALAELVSQAIKKKKKQISKQQNDGTQRNKKADEARQPSQLNSPWTETMNDEWWREQE
jgi:hypothetical protein